jgi:hypothetical protein
MHIACFNTVSKQAISYKVEKDGADIEFQAHLQGLLAARLLVFFLFCFYFSLPGR